MNQLFELTRFLRLLRAHWAESWKTYVWFFGVCVILNGIFLALALKIDGNRQYVAMQSSVQATWYAYGLVVTGLVFATRYFENFSGTGSTLIQLMRPASSFEKWCLALLLVGVLFPLVYTAIYACMNSLAVAYAKEHYVKLANQSVGTATSHLLQIYLPFTSMHPDGEDTGVGANVLVEELVFAFEFLAGLAICMGGRVFFKRAAVLKTWLLAFGLLVIGFCIAMSADAWFIAADVYGRFADQGVPTFDTLDAVLTWAIIFGAPILLWIGLFFHIKEREVS